MGSVLSRVQKGKVHKPPRITIYGVPGIGKSTFAASAPSPIFVQTEDGLDEIDCERLPKAERLEDVFEQLQAVANEEHEYRTLVIDSADWLEKLVHKKVCADYGVTNIVKADGGYARGYDHAVDYFREILAALDYLRNELGMIVILTAHTKVTRYEDPETAAYNQIVPRLHEKASGLIGEWSDAVLYATRKVRVQSEDAGFNKKRTTAVAVGKDGGDRILKCVGGPSCAAKNRYRITEELPLSWAAFEAALAQRMSLPEN